MSDLSCAAALAELSAMNNPTVEKLRDLISRTSVAQFDPSVPTRATNDSGGTLWVYSPPVGNGTSGRVIPAENGPKIHGLNEARIRLARLEEMRKCPLGAVLK